MNYIIDTSRNFRYDGGRRGEGTASGTMNFEGSEWEDLQKVHDLPGGTPAYCIDYEELDASLKSEIGGQVLAYAPIKKKWCPI